MGELEQQQQRLDEIGRLRRGLRLACETLARERIERWADETGEAVGEDGVRLATADVMREIMGQVDREGEQ